MKIKTSDLYNAIKFVTPARAGKNSINEAYKGIKIVSNGETAELVTTCGSALHYCKIDLLEISPAEEFICEIFDVEKTADKNAFTTVTLSDDKKTVTVTQSSQGVIPKTEVVNAIDGSFLDYRRFVDDCDTFDSSLSILADPVLS